MNNFDRDLSYQASASLIQDGIRQQQILQDQTIERIFHTAAERMKEAGNRLSDSLSCVDRVRDFTSKPNSILGSMATKHGEIAEHVEVEIRNGRNILNGLRADATFENVGRTAPEDYIINGIKVQSKFINGFNNSLDAVLGHLDKYPDFTANGYYKIPKDQFDIINRIANGEVVEGISTRSINKCREAISLIEKETGKSFSEVVFPSVSDYGEVQLGTIDKTLDGYESEFTATHKKQAQEIKAERDSAKEVANHITDFSFKEALKYGAISAAITGGVAASINIYTKIRSGKKLSDFTLDDWKEIGIDFGKNGLKGGITGIGIYTITNVGNFSAPFAGAVASAGVGIASMYSDYKKGNLSEQDFSCAINSLCVESGMAAIGAAIGQVVIPVPLLGAVIGTAVSKASIEIARYICAKDENGLIAKMEEEYNSNLDALSKNAQKIIAQMELYYNRLGGFIEAALSPESAARLSGSIELCRFFKIPEEEIIHSTDELDIFMLA